MYENTPTVNLLIELSEIEKQKKEIDSKLNLINKEIETRENQIAEIFETAYILKWKQPNEDIRKRINSFCKVVIEVDCISNLNRKQVIYF